MYLGMLLKDGRLWSPNASLIGGLTSSNGVDVHAQQICFRCPQPCEASLVRRQQTGRRSTGRSLPRLEKTHRASNHLSNNYHLGRGQTDLPGDAAPALGHSSNQRRRRCIICGDDVGSARRRRSNGEGDGCGLRRDRPCGGCGGSGSGTRLLELVLLPCHDDESRGVNVTIVGCSSTTCLISSTDKSCFCKYLTKQHSKRLL